MQAPVTTVSATLGVRHPALELGQDGERRNLRAGLRRLEGRARFARKRIDGQGQILHHIGAEIELIAGKQIRGSWGGGARPDEDIPRLAQLYARGELPIADLANARYPLENVNQALDDLEAGRVLRPLLDMALPAA